MKYDRSNSQPPAPAGKTRHLSWSCCQARSKLCCFCELSLSKVKKRWLTNYWTTQLSPTSEVLKCKHTEPAMAFRSRKRPQDSFVESSPEFSNTDGAKPCDLVNTKNSCEHWQTKLARYHLAHSIGRVAYSYPEVLKSAVMFLSRWTSRHVVWTVEKYLS